MLCHDSQERLPLKKPITSKCLARSEPYETNFRKRIMKLRRVSHEYLACRHNPVVFSGKRFIWRPLPEPCGDYVPRLVDYWFKYFADPALYQLIRGLPDTFVAPNGMAPELHCSTPRLSPQEIFSAIYPYPPEILLEHRPTEGHSDSYGIRKLVVRYRVKSPPRDGTPQRLD